MQNRQWSLQDAKNKFSEVVNAADAGIPQIVTKRGVPTAVVLSVKDFTKVKELLSVKIPTLTEHLLNMPVTTDDVDSVDGIDRLDIKPRDFL